MKLPVLFTAIAISIAGQANAASVEMALSEDNAKLSTSAFVGGFSDGRTSMNVGYFYDTNDSYIIDLGLHMVDVVGSKTPGLQVGVGMQAYLTDVADHQGAAISLGGSISYRAPQLKRVNFVVHGHYAPGITSYMDTERFREVGVSIEYSLLPQADIFIGYRDIQINEDSRELSIDDSGHLGLRITF